MQKLHKWLKQSLPAYQRWHTNTYHQHHHWLVALVALIVASYAIAGAWQLVLTETNQLSFSLSFPPAQAQQIQPLIKVDLNNTQANPKLTEPVGSFGYTPAELSYTMGAGDLDGDGDYDYIARMWVDNGVKADESFNTRTYAIRSDGGSGEVMWNLNHQRSWADNIADPTWTVTLSTWNMDGQPGDEVITQVKEGSQVVLVMLDGQTGQEKRRTTLGGVSSVGQDLGATVAYLDGPTGDPYFIFAHGPSNKVIAFDKNLNERWRFDNPKYNGAGLTPLRTFNADQFSAGGDQNDEILAGTIILDHDGSVLLDGTDLPNGSNTGAPQDGIAARTFLADIDHSNNGLEWYISREGRVNANEYKVAPQFWKGPYLIDVDKGEIIWHDNVNQSVASEQGWGRVHRGWTRDVDANQPGLEIWTTGFFWEGTEWQDALNGLFGTPPTKNSIHVPGYSERYFLHAADQTQLSKVQGTHVGYPIYWDDDPEAEYYRYRGGKMQGQFEGSTIQTGFPPANGSGEVSIADVTGDWREELIYSSGYDFYVFSNPSSTAFPSRASFRDDHNYLMNLASIGTGLPKPLMTAGLPPGSTAPPPPAPPSSPAPAPGTKGPPPPSSLPPNLLRPDLNCDDIVDVKDFGILMSWWGPVNNYSHPGCS